MKFRADRPEEVCCKVVPGEKSERYKALGHGGVICLRIAGHKGDCIESAGDAARADGVCHHCRGAHGADECPEWMPA